MGIKESTYYFVGAPNPREVARATTSDTIEGPSFEVVPKVVHLKELPFEFTLIKSTITKKGIVESNDLSSLDPVWLDSQFNRFAWPLYSERLMRMVKTHLTGEEGVEWMSAKINGNGEQRIYYIPKFTKQLDVLDIEHTTYVPSTGSLLRPAYSRKKIQNLAMFHKPSSFWEISASIIFNEALTKAIKKEKMTGLLFEKVKVM